ncbi:MULTISPECIES: glycosyltransferase [unclassified Neochlamydia]|uniref:glycosyltransferase family protein n=1 Tax=unclassified Neochlamydia TaxID=2643326 RepID=UPI001BCA0CD4|nr:MULTISPECIES: glycosyltransferase [unclassified Neochlamydia]
MVKKVDLITPYGSQYRVLHHFTKKLYEAWIRAGYEARFFEDATEALKVMLLDPPDLIVGFNGVPRHDQIPYSDILKKPYLSLIVDPFYHFLSEISSPYVIIGCDDFSSVTAFKNTNFHQAFFVPHAVESDLTTDSEVEKIFEVSMLATFIDYEARREQWRLKYPLQVCEAMYEAVEQTFLNPQLAFIEATLGKVQWAYYNHPELRTAEVDIISLLKDVELYIKGKERIDILKAIHTVPVHVFGHSVDKVNWKSYFKNQSNIITHDAVTYEKSIEIMKQSKIVLNSSIKNKFGAHERIFTALAAGALVITNENDYLKNFFSHDVDIAFYQYHGLLNLNQMIVDYLADEDHRQQVAENGREIVMTYHTWDARIREFEKNLFPRIEAGMLKT